MRRQSTRVRAVRIDDPDVVLIAEGDAPVIRDPGESRELDRLGCLRAEYGDGVVRKAVEVAVPRRELVLRAWKRATGWR